VWAAKKVLLDGFGPDVDAVVPPDVADALAVADPLRPRRANASTITHTEIYLPEQVIAVFRDGVAMLVSHMSSGELDADGEPAEWCEIVTIDTDERGNPLAEPIDKDICGRSKTPGGVFEFYRRVDGFRHGALGSMWNPVYFNYGIAVHGATTVPNRPASHGCVRIPMHIADYFPTLVGDGDTVLVWNGRNEPEQVTEDDRLPVFDYPNPDATTTTTTTTAPSTITAAPTTTAAPAPAPSTPATTPEVVTG
jgi:L,D-transpeptidase catalytic domain